MSHLNLHRFRLHEWTFYMTINLYFGVIMIIRVDLCDVIFDRIFPTAQFYGYSFRILNAAMIHLNKDF